MVNCERGGDCFTGGQIIRFSAIGKERGMIKSPKNLAGGKDTGLLPRGGGG